MTHAPRPLPDAEQLRAIAQTMRAWLFALARTVLALMAGGALDARVRADVRRVLRGALWQVRAMIFLRALMLAPGRDRVRRRAGAPPNTPDGFRATRRHAPFRHLTRGLFKRTPSLRALFAQVIAGLRRMDRLARRVLARIAGGRHGGALRLVVIAAGRCAGCTVAPAVADSS